MIELPPHTLARRVMLYLSHVPQLGSGECWPWEPLPKFPPVLYWTTVEGKRTNVKGTHFAYWLKHGVWPMYVEHTCDYWPCHNWEHLLDSDHQANMQSAVERKRLVNMNKTHCPANHPYAVYARYGTRGNGSVFRICKACERIRTWKKRGEPAPGSRGQKRLTSPTAETD